MEIDYNSNKDIKVFILEDEEFIAKAMEKTLQDLGYTVAGKADSYNSAIEFVKNNTIDIAICDINLNEDKDGIDTAEAINQILPQPIPIIFLTAFHKSYKEKAFTFKPANYLIKMPFTEQHIFQLDAAIQVAISNHKLQPQNEETTSRVIGEHYDIWMSGVFERIKIHEIYYLKADNMATIIVTADKLWEVKSKSLGKVLGELVHKDIIRCNRSEAVNIKRLKYYNPGPTRISLDKEGLKPHLKDKVSDFISVSEGHRAEVRKALGLE